MVDRVDVDFHLWMISVGMCVCVRVYSSLRGHRNCASEELRAALYGNSQSLLTCVAAFLTNSSVDNGPLFLPGLVTSHFLCHSSWSEQGTRFRMTWVSSWCVLKNTFQTCLPVTCVL